MNRWVSGMKVVKLDHGTQTNHGRAARHDLTKLLRRLTASADEDLPLLTLSRTDEKSIRAHVAKKTTAKEGEEEKVFYGGGILGGNIESACLVL